MKQNIVFAGNEDLYKRFLFYYSLHKKDYAYASSRVSLMGYNHLNSTFILTDGYALNPAFGTDRYMLVVGLAKKANVKTFVIRKMMHET